MSFIQDNSSESMPGPEAPTDINVLLSRNNLSDFIDAVQACQFARSRANRFGQFHGDDTAFWGAVARQLEANADQRKFGIESN